MNILVSSRFGKSADLVLLALVLPILFGCSEPNAYQPPPPPQVLVARPVRQTVTSYLEETGSTEPVAMVDIRARVAGYLQKTHFEPGQVVAEGDLLFEIEDREYQAKVAASAAELERAQVARELAEIEVQRQEKLVAERATPQSNVDRARAARDEAKAMTDVAQAALDRAQIDLEYTKVTAPISGRIGKSLVKTGNLVGDTDATHLTTIVAYDPIYVNFNISETELLRLLGKRKNGEKDENIRTIPAFMRRAVDTEFRFAGHLEYADLGVDQSTGTFMMRAVFPNDAMEIFPGLFVRIRIPVEELSDALLVPERAFSIDQAGRFLLVLGRDNVVERRNVEVGIKHGDLVVVTSGLAGDERVIVDGIQRARPGNPVSPTDLELTAPPSALSTVRDGSGSSALDIENAAEQELVGGSFSETATAPSDASEVAGGGPPASNPSDGIVDSTTSSERSPETSTPRNP